MVSSFQGGCHSILFTTPQGLHCLPAGKTHRQRSGDKPVPCFALQQDSHCRYPVVVAQSAPPAWLACGLCPGWVFLQLLPSCRIYLLSYFPYSVSQLLPFLKILFAEVYSLGLMERFPYLHNHSSPSDWHRGADLTGGPTMGLSPRIPLGNQAGGQASS